MNPLVVNLLLAVAWAALVGSFTLPSLALGFGLGYLALWAARPLFAGTTYFERVFRVLRLAGLFVYELVVSSFRVVWDVVTPAHLSRPGIIALPLDVEGEGGILLVSNLISLTPGSLSLDVSPDRRTLYVHAMFAEDPDALRRELKQGMERRVIEALQ
ncbi:MAG: Na+/H+ antiporter subunit E [Kiloniellales bacterium]|nr:Na+/H+ antiporter subunit E [Kiloniellales bacterium]